MPNSSDVVVLGGVLQGEGHIEFAAEVLDVERGVSGRGGRVGEGPDRSGVTRVEHVDRTGVEVGRVEQILGVGDAQPLVHRIRHGEHLSRAVPPFQPSMVPFSLANMKTFPLKLFAVPLKTCPVIGSLLGMATTRFCFTPLPS